MAQRSPTIFFGHGNPMNAALNNRYTEAWRHIGQEMAKPKAILWRYKLVSRRTFIGNPTRRQSLPQMEQTLQVPRQIAVLFD